MIDHTGIGVAHVGRSAAFYDAALGTLGLRRVMQNPKDDKADGSDILDRPLSSPQREAAYGLRCQEPRRGRRLLRSRPSKRVEPITARQGSGIQPNDPSWRAISQI